MPKKGLFDNSIFMSPTLSKFVIMPNKLVNTFGFIF